jgi:hypothetical protein
MIVSILDTINHQESERNLFLKKTYGEVLYLKLRAIIARERLPKLHERHTLPKWIVHHDIRKHNVFEIMSSSDSRYPPTVR